MRTEINPVVATVVVVVLLVVIGVVAWTQSGGKTFTKDEVRAGSPAGIGMKMGK